ncbi:stalk domain-containing protein [Paenibacillus sp. y28]|uniref:stalk domain-containing protein n=1 Tax=Paenibacillus sp. y28 TaxID=3129110 RepID=UPI00301909C9
MITSHSFLHAAKRLAAGRASKKAACILSAVVLCAGLLQSFAPAPASAEENIWITAQRAQAAVDRGDAAAAVPIWRELVDRFSAGGDWESAAIYCGRLNEYFDAANQYEQAIYYYELEDYYWRQLGKDWGAIDVMRADQLRTTLDLYISSGDEQASVRRASSASGQLAKYEPAYGAYIGIYSEQDPAMNNNFVKSKDIYGKNHAIYLAYSGLENKFPGQYAVRAKEAGGALQIALEPRQGLDAVVDGEHIRQWARDAKAAGIPIFLRFACEMNGNWTVWSGDPDKFIEKFRLVHDIMAEEAPNVAMVWSPNDVPKYSMDPYYPGDEYVDWVGISLYTEPYENGDPSLPMLATSPVERLDELYRLYADRKPLMISETAVSHYAHAAGQSVTDWALLNLQRLYEVMPKKYPRLKAITYFNVDLQDRESRNDYLLSDNPEMFDLYKRMIASPYFLSSVQQGARPADGIGYTPLEENGAFARKARIVPFAKHPGVGISRIDYVLNGEVIAEARKAPFDVTLTAGQVPEGSVLEAIVYDDSGNAAARRVFGISSQVSVSIDGKLQRFEQPPVIVEGNTLAPLRAIFEAMGASVDWDADTQTASGRKSGTEIKLSIGETVVRKNGQSSTLEQPAQLINGFTMAPVRFVGEAFGGQVSYDKSTRTVEITASK